MTKRLTIEQKIQRAQELGEQRWNAMVRKEEEELRREAARSERQAQARRSRIRIVRGPA